VLTDWPCCATRNWPNWLPCVLVVGGFFQPIQVEGELELVTGSRMWPERWSDALAIRGQGDAKGFRCDPVGGVVWQREGGLVEVVEGLVELPGPDEPGAPQLVKSRAPRLWVPS